MPQVDVYVPCYMLGKPGSKNEGKLSYQYAKINAVVTHAKVPEGEVMISSRVIGKTPPAELQPDDS